MPDTGFPASPTVPAPGARPAAAAQPPLSVTAGSAALSSTDASPVDPFATVSVGDPNGPSAQTAIITLSGAGAGPGDADGTLSGGGLTRIAAGTYTLSAADAPSLAAALQALTFTPTPHQVAPGASVATTFALSVSDAAGSGGTLATPIILTATAVPAQPVFTAPGPATIATTDTAAVNPFTGDTVSDPTLGVTDTVVVVLSDAQGRAGDAAGTLSGPGVSESSVGSGTYMVSGSPASLNHALPAILFTPTAHLAAPGASSAATLSLALFSPGTAPVAAGAVVVEATAQADPPTISGTAPSSGTAGVASRPLSGVVVASPDQGATESVTLTLIGPGGQGGDSSGTLSGLIETGPGSGVYVVAGSPAAVTAALEAATFTPAAYQSAPGAGAATTLALAVSGGGGVVTDARTVFTAIAPDTAPAFSGLPLSLATGDETPVQPLAGVGVIDPDLGATETLTIALQGTGDTTGTLSGAGVSETSPGSGTYTLGGSPASIAAALRTLTFTPTAHQAAPGGSVSTTLALSLTDGLSSPTTANVVVAATATHDPMVVTNDGPVATSTSGTSATTPFAGIAIVEPDFGTSATATIVVSGADPVTGATLAPAGLAASAPGTYVLAAAPPAQLAAELDHLAFTPTGAGTFTLGLTINDSLGDSRTPPGATITVRPAGQGPTIGGLGSLAAISDGQTAAPFAHATIADSTTGATETVTITLLGANGSGAADGTLSGYGIAQQIGTTGTYTVTGTPGDVTTSLRGAVFTPTAHQVASGQSVATTFLLSASSASFAPVTAATSIVVAAASDAPALSLGRTGAPSTDLSGSDPLTSATLSDPDLGATETVTLTLTSGGVTGDATGTLSAPGLHETSPGTYTVFGSPASLTAALRAMTFMATQHQVAPGDSVDTTLGIAVSKPGFAPLMASTVMTITAVAAYPVLAGAQPGAGGSFAVSTSDATPAIPFAGLTLQDPTVGVTDTATLTLLDSGGNATDADGTLAGAVETAPGSGTYTISGTQAQVSAALDAVAFTPTRHQVSAGGSVTTTIETVLSNGFVTSRAPDTVVTATAISDPATISGTAPVADPGAQPARPFSSLTIADPDLGAVETVTVRLLDASGNPSDAGGTLTGTGLRESAAGSGLYVVSGSAAAVTAALDHAVFIPDPAQAPGSSVSTTFALSVSSDGGPAVTDAATVFTATAQSGTSSAGVIALGSASNTTPTTDAVAVPLFPSLTLADPSVQGSDSATLSFDPALGTLSGLGGGALSTDGGTYTVSGTPAGVQAALRALVFTPTPDEAQPGAPISVPFTLVVTDGTDRATATSTVDVTRTSGATFAWLGAGGDLGTSGRWLQNGAQLRTTPGSTDVATLATGSATPYALSGSATVAELRVLGDKVVLAGSVAATAPGTGLDLEGGGALTVSTGATLVTAGAASVSSGLLTLEGVLRDAALSVAPGGELDLAGSGAVLTTSGTLTVQGLLVSTDHAAEHYGTLVLAGGESDIDSTVQATGAIESAGGTLVAIAQPGAQPGGTGGTVTQSGALTLAQGTTATVGSRDGATLVLAGTISGGGTLAVRGGTVVLSGAPSGGAVLVAGATLDIAGAQEQGLGPVSTLAGTTNSLMLGNDTGDVASNGTDTILLGSGTLTLHVTGSAAITGGTGQDTIDATGAAPVTVSGGSGDVTVTGTADAVIDGANSGSVTYQGSGRLTFAGVAAGGSESVTLAASGAITTGSGANTVLLTGGDHVVTSTGNDTITSSGAGSDTVSASGSLARVINAGGALHFVGGAGAYTVNGGAGSITVSGGALGGFYQGGSAGSNVLTAGGANTTLVGGGAGDQLTGSATGANQLLGGAGAETLHGGGGLSLIASSTGDSLITTGAGVSEVYGGTGGHDTILSGSGQTFVISQGGESVVGGVGQSIVYGGAGGGDTIQGGAADDVMVAGGGSEQMRAGTGNDTMYAGSGGSTMTGGDAGSTLMVGGQVAIDFQGGAGQTTVFGSQGNDTIAAGSGAMLAVEGGGASQFLFGSGSSTVFSGSGGNSFVFTDGQGGGTDVIIGFKQGQDTIALSGFGGQAVAQQQVEGGSTVVTLTDGTNVVFSGVATLAAGTFR